MAAPEMGGPRPAPSEQTGPRGTSLGGGKSAEGGIQIIPYTPRMGEMVQVYRGPTAPGDSAIVRINVLEPTQKFTPWIREAHRAVGAHYDGLKTSEGGIDLPTTNGQETTLFTPPSAGEVTPPPPTPSDGGIDEEALMEQVWAKYTTEQRTANYTIIGKMSSKMAFHANRELIEAMANAKIPTPPEMEEVVKAYQHSPKEGKKAFQDFYASTQTA